MSTRESVCPVPAVPSCRARVSRRVTLAMFAMAAAFALGACSGSGTDARGVSGEPDATAATTTTLPAAVVKSTIDDGATDVPVTSHIGISVEHGTIEDVTLTSGAAAAFGSGPTDGLLNSEATAWMSPTDFAPSSPYRIEATVLGADGESTEHTWDFTTGAPVEELHTSINAGDGITYGVGMPIIVTLNNPAPPELHDAVVERLKVTSEPAVEGGWRWFSDSELHYRPAEFWPAHTSVHLDVDFTGLHLGKGIWGVDGRTVDFTIGDAHVTTVDAATHQMTVRVNGEVVNSFPISTGRPGPTTETRSGVHVVNEKAPLVVMDSSTIGIPVDSPGGYKIDAEWSVRISNSGEFVHSAPWSVGSQGYANVSHGCVNAAPDDAKWFYDMTMTGDVVAVTNTPRQLEPWNGYGDWQIPWAEWVN